jgi:hypothetical protein
MKRGEDQAAVAARGLSFAVLVFEMISFTVSRDFVTSKSQKKKQKTN